MDHRELTALAKDPPRLRALAAQLLAHADEDLGEASRKYLADLARYDGARRLGVAQLEWLDDLRERAHRYRKLGPYRAADLVRAAFEARLDLADEDQAAWVEALAARGGDIALRRSEARRLLAIVRALDLIDGRWVDL